VTYFYMYLGCTPSMNVQMVKQTMCRMLPSAVVHFVNLRLSPTFASQRVFSLGLKTRRSRPIKKTSSVHTDKMYTFPRLFQPNTKASLFGWGGFGSPDLHPDNEMTTAPTECCSSYPLGIEIQNESLLTVRGPSVFFLSPTSFPIFFS
jgi:hypothetical protein